ESARLFFRVEKISIPSRVVRIMAARMRDHRRNAVVRLKPYAFANLFGIKTERAVLVMRGMKIAAGKEWSHLEFEIGIIRRDEFPRHKDGRFAFWDEQLVLDDEIVDLVTPARPRLVFERFNTWRTVRMNYIRAVALGRDRKRAARRFHPCVEAVREDHSPRRRSGCGQQQRVIPTSANSGDRSAGESAKAVRLEPLGVRINWIHHAPWNRSGTAKSRERTRLRLSAS